MNLNFKHKTIGVIAASSLLLTPLNALAVDSGTMPTKNQDFRQKPQTQTERIQPGAYNKNVCTKISSASGVLRGLLEKQKGDRGGKRESLIKNLTDRKQKIDEKLDSLRDNGDAKRNANYDKLLEKATTDTQKQAVETFKTTIEKAVTDRRAAVDTALKTFRDGIAGITQTREQGLEDALNKMKTAVDTAFSQAEADCNAEVEPTTIRTNLQNALKAAKTQFETDRKALEQTKTQLETLKKTRDENIKAALDTFKETTKQATTTLKAAFAVK